MTLTIELPPDVEARLKQQAETEGVTVEEAGRRLIEAAYGGGPTKLAGFVAQLALTVERLDLPPEVEQWYLAKMQTMMQDVIKRGISKIKVEPSETVGARILREWEEAGVLGSRTDIEDSAAYARQLREEAQNRVRE